MSKPDFPFLVPTLPPVDQWAGRLTESYEAGHYSNGGPLFQKLNLKIQDGYLSKGYEACAVTSNTLGLQAVMHALELRGKRVAMPDFTFAATIQAALAAGAHPVIFDVDETTTELCAKAVDRYLSSGGKLDAIVHVRCFGFARDISAIREVAKRHEIPLIIDAAAALGIPGEREFGSTHGEIEVFSLHATKVFAIGEGGVVAAPSAMMKKIQNATNFGFQPDRKYVDGTNAKIDEFRSAIGLSMMEQIGALVETRRQHARRYLDYFLKAGVGTPVCAEIENSWSMFPVMMDKPVTDELIEALSDAGVEVRRYYFPCISKAYIGPSTLDVVSNSVATDIDERIICFPIYSTDSSAFWDTLVSRIAPVLSRISQGAA